MRSLLFVPGDSARKFEKARGNDADVLILDLEDSVAAEAKERGREETAKMLAADRGRQRLYVRVNAFDTGLTLADLARVMPLAPDGIMLPKCSSGADVQRLSNWLDAFEAAAGREPGATRIIAIATETAGSIFGLGSYKDAGARLEGLLWGAEDLAASLGATTNSVGDDYSEPFRLARNLCLMAAAAAGVTAIDTISTRIRDLDHVAAEARAARRDGFGAKAVIHPDHVPLVNAAFTPTEEEALWAEKVVAAFRDAPASGVVNIDGRMIDKPHERAALKILAALGR